MARHASALRLAPPPVDSGPRDRSAAGGTADDERSLLVPVHAQRSGPRLIRCLVTPVDGRGRGSIVVSVNQSDQRRTAAFLCDVRLGICDVVGEVEPESPRAGGLIDALDQQPEGDCARDVPELALGLLAGSLMLCKPAVPPPVRDWLARNARARVSAGRIARRQSPAWIHLRSPRPRCPRGPRPCSTHAPPGWIPHR